MYTSKKLLDSILNTTQMGQIGIRSVLDSHMNASLRKALESQLREYDAIETDAHELAVSKGWQLKELDPAIRKMTDLMTRIRLSFGDPESKIAAMMIQGNTRGMIIGLKDLHRTPMPDAMVSSLSSRLLECEDANIQQMRGFL